VLLIDGYNVLFKSLRGAVSGRRLIEQRDLLVARIGRYCVATNQRARIYFDPKRGRNADPFDRVRKKPPVEVVELSDLSADDAIRSIVEAEKDRTAYRVVTSDREVADAARRRNFETVPSEDFLGEMDRRDAGTPEEKPDGMPPENLKYWMDQFGLGGTPR
jgi:predicted RNA-binding protein with PIN domain